MNFLDTILTAAILIVGFFVMFFIGKTVHNLFFRSYKLTRELVENDNPAVALAVVGYYFGLIIAIGGTLVGPTGGLVNDLLDLAIYGLLSIILLNLSWFLCDTVMLNKFKIRDELLRDRNQGTGVVSFAVSIASGLIIYGSVSGQGGSIWTAVAFWALGQCMLILAFKVYNLITPYNVHDEIEKDNVAAGVSIGGAIIGMGIVVGLAAEGDFHAWSEDLPGFLFISLIGLLLLPVIRFLTDRVLMPTVRLTDEIVGQEVPNVGAAYIEAMSYIAAAFIIYWCV